MQTLFEDAVKEALRAYIAETFFCWAKEQGYDVNVNSVTFKPIVIDPCKDRIEALDKNERLDK